tara:strand:- start:1423 stop:1605 length:183 start_codon:yes stop_codon:yes gene_type:complete
VHLAAIAHNIKTRLEWHGQEYLKFTQKRVKSGAGMLVLFFALKNRLTAVDKSVLTGMNLV